MCFVKVSLLSMVTPRYLDGGGPFERFAFDGDAFSVENGAIGK